MTLGGSSGAGRTWTPDPDAGSAQYRLADAASMEDLVRYKAGERTRVA